jgi:hypothetical protein
MESVSTALKHPQELSSSADLTGLIGVKCSGNVLYRGISMKEFKLTGVFCKVRQRPCVK